MTATNRQRRPGLRSSLVAISFAAHHALAAEHAVMVQGESRAAFAHESVAGATRAAISTVPGRARFEREHASPDARHIADWVVDSGDNGRMPFMIVDKIEAKVFVFDADGRLRGAAPALLGLARGDDSVPGIGDRELSSIRPEERTTPAGRFIASLDRNLKGEKILWIDYDTSISLHRVVAGKPSDRRQQRLATPTPLDNRISYGCINVSGKFYDHVVTPAFAGTNGVVYVLPETRSIKEFFDSYHVGAQRPPTSVQSATRPSRPAEHAPDL
jgi:hypothetical protein